MAIDPKHESLDNPVVVLDHLNNVSKRPKFTAHSEILDQLLTHFEKVNFKASVFPEVKRIEKEIEDLKAKLEAGEDNESVIELRKQLEKYKPNNKHYLVLAIEEVLKVAKANNWGICKNYDFIYVYNGAFWSDIDKEAFQKFLGEAAERMGVTQFTAKYYQFREQLYKQFLATAYLPTPEAQNDTVLINLQNGTFEIGPKLTELRYFNQSDFLTYQLPFEFKPSANAPVFQEYLDRVLPDRAKQMILAEYLGYVFIKHGSKALKEEKALILYGGGANGKSVFFEVTMALIGHVNVGNHSLQNLTNENGYYRAKIANKLLNYSSDINTRLEAAMFKLLVSGEPVEARLPYGEPFTMKQYAKLIFNCNELPKDVEHTEAYFRRFLILHFDVTIPSKEQDKTLGNRIIDSELSGVFNWVLDGLKRLLRQKRFTSCEAVDQILDNYRRQSDTVSLFIDEENYKPTPDESILLKDLYQQYRSFCIDDGHKPLNKQNFSKRLANLKILVERKNVGNSVGIKKIEE